MVRKKTGAFNAEHPFGKPEESSNLKIMLLITFIIIGICVITFMLANAPEERRLKCSGPSSLISFGSCVLEDD